MKAITIGLLAVCAISIAASSTAPPEGTPEFDLTWHRIAGGGETFSTGGGYELGGTIGQHEAGTMSGGDYTLTGGFWVGGDVEPPPPCAPADLNCDRVVDVSDLLILLGAWGDCPPSGDCPADINGDGVVDVSDLLLLLGNWG